MKSIRRNQNFSFNFKIKAYLQVCAHGVKRSRAPSLCISTFAFSCRHARFTINHRRSGATFKLRNAHFYFPTFICAVWVWRPRRRRCFSAEATPFSRRNPTIHFHRHRLGRGLTAVIYVSVREAAAQFRADRVCPKQGRPIMERLMN